MKKYTFREHFRELKRRFLQLFGMFIIAFGLCYWFSDNIYRIILSPLIEITGDNSRKIIYTSLTEAFFSYIKLSPFAAFVLFFPFCWSFVVSIAARTANFSPKAYLEDKDEPLPINSFGILTAVNRIESASFFGVLAGSGVPAATGGTGLSSPCCSVLDGGAPASTVIMIASCGGSVGRRGEAHHSTAAARPCSESASTSATGDIWLDFEVRALTGWATALRYYVPAWGSGLGFQLGRRLADRGRRPQSLRLNWSGRRKFCRVPVMSGGNGG